MAQSAADERDFVLSRHLSQEEIRSVLAISNGASLLALVTTFGVIAATFALLAVWPHPLTYALGLVLLGGRQLALGMLAHEAAHRALFTNRHLNAAAGWVCGWLVWSSNLERYRQRHIRHHNQTGTEADPNLGLIQAFPMSRSRLIAGVVIILVGVSALRTVFVNLLVALELMERPDAGADLLVARRARPWEIPAALVRNLSGVLLVHAALFGILWLAGHPELYAMWWIAWATTYHLFSNLRSVVDHACTPDPVHPLLNSRTVGAPFWERLTLSPHNGSFHLEHHLLMTAPCHNLPKLRRILAQHGLLERATPEEPSTLRAMRHLVRKKAGTDRPAIS